MNDSIKIQYLRDEIISLHTKIDSIKSSNDLAQIKFELNQKQDIISQINDFYDSAWLKLIIVISLLGILVPIIAQYFQRKNLKDLTEFITKQMNDSLDFKINELKNFNQTEIEKTIANLEQNINRLEAKSKSAGYEIDAGLFFLQAQNNFIKKKYVQSIKDFTKSTFFYLETNRVSRIKVACNNIWIVIKLLNKVEELDEVSDNMKKNFKMSFEEMIVFFENHKHKELYKEDIENIKDEIDRLRNVG